MKDRILNGISVGNRPWGFFETYVENTKCTVKIITVNPNHCLSLQSHKNRDELWIFLDGGLVVEVNGEKKLPQQGEKIFIERGVKHRLASDGNSGKVLEISLGDYDENDIVRYEDRYNRK